MIIIGETTPKFYYTAHTPSNHIIKVTLLTATIHYTSHDQYLLELS